MFDLGALENAKSKAKINKEKQNSGFEDEFNKAILFLQDYTNDLNQETLNQAIKHLYSSLYIKKNNIYPYLYLAYIFYLFNDKSKAESYLSFAEILDINHEEIAPLKAYINSI